MSVKRYDIGREYIANVGTPAIAEDPKGRFVMYADFKALQDQNDKDLRALAHERARADRLQRILDSRPALNAGLPQTYIDWSQGIYIMDTAHAQETPQ